MASLVDRLRVRSNRKVYTDDLDEDEFLLEKDQTTKQLQVNRLSKIEKILDSDMRPITSDNLVFVKQYFVKWKGLSYMHCSWVSSKDFEEAYKFIPLLKRRVENFDSLKETASNNKDDFVAIRSEWTTVDRIIASRGEGDGKEYLVKFKELPYNECYWEAELDISTFGKEIQRFKDVNSISRKDQYANREKSHMEFTHFGHTPGFLTGMLHPYQIEGLNFLWYSWSNRTHVILADEMGLGKTIQSIAYLASLFEEGHAPYLVVGPLTTLTNWEREFAIWAPQLNVIMYSGSSDARTTIRDYEFYFPKGRRTKQERIKFDVLLISYELINKDTTFLKPIKWKCLIVDEGHRMKNKDSKLFASLKQYSSEHRILLTGTPLQNNLDELFMLMHFLDPKKFGSLEEFQKEFKDIQNEEQISRLHKMLSPHMLRRLKKDVLKDMPPKKELILRVDLSSQQKDFYKAILTSNFQVLGKKHAYGGKVRNVLMELRKVCLHPYMLEGVEPDIEDSNDAFKALLESSGKMQLLDKLMVKLKEQGHRVLIFSQFQYMLDLLEGYCNYKEWLCERIDGTVAATERQIRIDRFNAKTSNRFCFFISTRAGGLGINLATADTVIIYDSDWNPHADLQAISRAHRIGQENKVMIYRLINRGTVEEKMMQMTKNKLLMEHLVVGKLKVKNLSQEQLDDIIKYGSKEIFSEENEEAGKSGKIYYDDAAIEKLLDRDHVDAEEVSVDDEEENGFLKAFKVANFECLNEEQAQAVEIESLTGNPDRASYWEALLKDKYEAHQAEELNSLGKRKRICKQILVPEGDEELAIKASSDEECEIDPNDEEDDDEDDEEEEPEQKNLVGQKPCRKRKKDNVEAEQENLVGRKPVRRRKVDGKQAQQRNQVVKNPTRKRKDDEEKYETGNQIAKKPTRKRKAHCAELTYQLSNLEPAPLMSGEGKSLKVLGFKVTQRRYFYQLVSRYGVGDYAREEFKIRTKKTYPEIKAYGTLFLKHLYEEDSNGNSLTFSDGVPKEGIKIEEVLGKIAILKLIQEKVKFCEEHPTEPVFPDRILREFQGLKSGQYWKEEHDKVLLRAVLKHGFRKYELINNDKELRIQQVTCQEVGIPYANLIAAEQAGCDKTMLTSLLDYVKNRGYLLEMAITYECAAEYYGPNGLSSLMHAEQVETETNVGGGSVNAYIEMMLDQLPQGRVQVTQLYEEMCILCESSRKIVLTYFNKRKVRNSFKPLESISENMNKSLSVTGTDHDVEMRDSVHESTIGSSNFVDLTLMEKEEEVTKDVDVKMGEAHNVIVLD